MKTRTNQPIDLLVVSNEKIRQLTDEQCNSLKQGDIVLKKTGKQYHTYIVSYKGEGSGEGICLTYTASGYIETISYDYTGGHWVYNSTDVFVADDYAKLGGDASFEVLQAKAFRNTQSATFEGSVSALNIPAGSGTYLLNIDNQGAIKKSSLGSIISLGTLAIDGEGDTPTAYFQKTLTANEYNSIPASALCVLMFNTTCVILPFIKLQDNRVVASVIYDSTGNSRVSRLKIKVFDDTEGLGKQILVQFDSDTASAMYNGGLVAPTGIIRFISI